MEGINTFQNPGEFANYLSYLKKTRRENLVKNSKRQRLTRKQRLLILSKTEDRCHICGIKIINERFEADHVKSHASGGEHKSDNYLASCFTCNNYRWHYGPEEIQWILKLGVWAKTHIRRETKFGISMANEFVNHEIKRDKRRKTSKIDNSQ